MTRKAYLLLDHDGVLVDTEAWYFAVVHNHFTHAPELPGAAHRIETLGELIGIVVGED